jgi:hypothetical protein
VHGGVCYSRFILTCCLILCDLQGVRGMQLERTDEDINAANKHYAQTMQIYVGNSTNILALRISVASFTAR